MIRFRLMGMVLFVLASLAQAGAAPAPDDSAKIPAHLAKARLEIARKVYEKMRDGKGGGHGNLYTWSRRWLDAELALCKSKKERITAYKAHLERMRSWQKMNEELFRDRAIDSGQFEATKYFPIEAEIWLWQAEHK